MVIFAVVNKKRPELLVFKSIWDKIEYLYITQLIITHSNHFYLINTTN